MLNDDNVKYLLTCVAHKTDDQQERTDEWQAQHRDRINILLIIPSCSSQRHCYAWNTQLDGHRTHQSSRNYRRSNRWSFPNCLCAVERPGNPRAILQQLTWNSKFNSFMVYWSKTSIHSVIFRVFYFGKSLTKFNFQSEGVVFFVAIYENI